MQVDRQVTEPGNLVTIKPGNYLTEISPIRESAMLLVEKPTLGIVLQKVSEKNGINLVQVQDELHNRIFAVNGALERELEIENGQ
jgi:hypothetical protein